MDLKKNHQSSREFEKKIIEANPEVFEGVPKEKRDGIIRAVAVNIKKTHSGPIPDSDSLREYDDIIPDGANRIMTMAEKQSDHRMGLEHKVISAQVFQSGMGQIFALVIGLFAIGCGTYCIVHGYEFGGSFLGVGGVTGLVTAFIKGKNSQREDLAAKKAAVQKQ